MKALLINAICNYLQDQIAIGNKVLCQQNLWDQQKPFDYGDMWLRLAFMSDEAIKQIAGKILG